MAINKVIYNNNTLIDLTSDTATESDVLVGKTFHKADGSSAVGTASGGITPSGTISITQNGTVDVTNYASADVNVSGGTTPSIGFVPTAWNSEGHITAGTWYGNSVPDYGLASGSTAANSYQYLTSVNFNQQILSVGKSAFNYSKINATNFVLNSDMIIYGSAFYYSLFNFYEITAYQLKDYAFSYCYITAKSKRNKIKVKVSIIGTSNSSSSNNVFNYCSSLKAVWIDKNTNYIYSKTTSMLPFYQCGNLTDIYTDASSKPSNWGSYWNYTKSTVQATVHYGYSEADFDALVVE